MKAAWLLILLLCSCAVELKQHVNLAVGGAVIRPGYYSIPISKAISAQDIIYKAGGLKTNLQPMSRPVVFMFRTIDMLDDGKVRIPFKQLGEPLERLDIDINNYEVFMVSTGGIYN
jgi:hypothetical protein